MPKPQGAIVDGFSIVGGIAGIVYLIKEANQRFGSRIRKNLSPIIILGYIGVILYGMLWALLIFNPAEIMTLLYQVLIMLSLLCGMVPLFWVTKKIDARYSCHKTN